MLNRQSRKPLKEVSQLSDVLEDIARRRSISAMDNNINIARNFELLMNAVSIRNVPDFHFVSCFYHKKLYDK